MAVKTEARVKQLKTVWQLKGTVPMARVVDAMSVFEINSFSTTFGIAPSKFAIVEYVNKVCQNQRRIMEQSQMDMARKLLAAEDK